MSKLVFDKIGYWSLIKLDIIRDYAAAYSRILAKQPYLKHVYIDAFAGGGVHKVKATGKLVPGSPLNALAVEPPFFEVHLIDLDGEKVESLRTLIGARKDVFIYEGDCNTVLMNKVFPLVRYEDYKRGLCLLDPYALTLDWDVVAKAAQMRSIEIFLNFPIMDMNRNTFWTNPAGVSADDLDRMDAFWGDSSWRNVVYTKQKNLFGEDELFKSAQNRDVALAFRSRLLDVAGFKHVPEPIPMRNAKNAVVYYLFFASNNETGEKIARHILKRYADHRV